MKYDICIVGHGNFPDGVKSAMNVLCGPDESLKLGNLNEQTTHEKFKSEMKEYLTTHENVIVFADMTGGAPYQIAAEIVLSQNLANRYVISGMSLNVVLDLYLKNMMDQLNPDNIEEMINHVISESCGLMKVTPCTEVVEEVEVEDGI